MSDKLHDFNGGLVLEDHKLESSQQALKTCNLPDHLILPLRQHAGEITRPRVKPGDYVRRNEIIATHSNPDYPPTHAPTSGTVRDINPQPVAHPSGQPDTCIVIDVDGEDAALHLEGIGLDEQEPETLIEYIGRAGVVGLGGAVFPTAVKLSRGRAQPVDTLIINGVECEPYITCDDVLMRYYPHEIIRGIGYLQRILAPARTVIAIEDNKPDALAAMRNALGNHPLPETTIACIPTRYPSGGEKQLVQIISGQQVPQGKLAMDIGFYCQNIGTCMAIAQALDHHQPLTSRIVTLTGNNINSPGNWEVRLGTPIAHLVEQADGYRHPAPRLFMGGPLMGFSLPGDNIPITKASHCVLAMQSGTTLNSQDQHNECIRCGKCNEVCPASLLPQQLYWHARSRAYEQIQDYHLFDCIECGCCAVVCPSQIPLVQYYRASKSEIRAQHKAALKSNRARERFEFRERRLAQRKQQEETRRRLKREALQKKRTTTGQTITPDPVKAALERVKARKQTSPTETR